MASWEWVEKITSNIVSERVLINRNERYQKGVLRYDEWYK